MSNIYIGSDNVVTLTGLKDVVADSYVNDADSVKMSVFKDATLLITSGDAVQEVQRLLIDAPATAGNFTLTYEGQTTSTIAYNATLAQVKTALETLSTIDSGDVEVTGNTLDTNPVGNGMIFTWKNTLGDVNLITFDVSGLTGPTQAGTTLIETTKGVLAGAAVDESGGIVGIPVLDHDLVQNDRVRIANSLNYNTEYALTGVTNDKIKFSETYAAETFDGNAKVYCGVSGACNISMSYVADSSGNYRGHIPDDAKGIIERAWYYIFIESIKGTTKRLDCVKWQATYASLVTL